MLLKKKRLEPQRRTRGIEGIREVEEEFNTLEPLLRLETLLSEALRGLLDPELKKILKKLLKMLLKKKLLLEAPQEVRAH